MNISNSEQYKINSNLSEDIVTYSESPLINTYNEPNMVYLVKE